MEYVEENIAAAGGQNIVKPRIEFDDPETYYMPQEFFTKALINSPVEFGTLELSRPMGEGEYPEHLVDAPPELRTGWVERRQIDLAMHPQLGALVCGYVEGEESAEIKSGLEEELRRLKKDREQLLARFASSYEMQILPVPPVGIFVAAPNAAKGAISSQWEMGSAFICTDPRMDRLATHMMSAMLREGDEHEGEPFVDWPRLMAVVEGEDYTSALRWLLIYEEI